MEKIKLDAKNKKILYNLDVNSRQSRSIIAKKVGLSREVVNYRIKILEERGIIEGYYSAIDTSKLGYLYCRIFMHCPSLSPEQEKEMVDYGLNHPSIGWITAGYGRWNVSFVIYVKNLVEFEKVYADLRFDLGKYFHEHEVSMAFKIYHFKHNYLFGTKDLSAAVLGEPGAVKYDTSDLEILSMLARDSTIRLLEIARETKLSPVAVKHRIRRLINSEVIIGFRTRINVASLGYEHHKVFLKLRNLNRKKYHEIFSYLSFEPSVIYITKAFGISDLEFEVILKGKNELYEFMQMFFSKFSEFIADYDSILYYREIIGYLPETGKE